jgi:hypothetical protein
MTEATVRSVSQADVDWYCAKYSGGSDDIDRWKAAGEIVIVDEKEKACEIDGNNNQK